MIDIFFRKKRMIRQRKIATITYLFDKDSLLPETKESTDNTLIAKKTKDFLEIFRTHWEYKTMGFEERYMTLFLTENFQVIGIGLDDIGDENSCNIQYERILDRCKKVNAKKIITAHNHTDTFVFPSMVDIKGEIELKNYLKSNNIELFDHIILSFSGRYFSFSSMFIL